MSYFGIWNDLIILHELYLIKIKDIISSISRKNPHVNLLEGNENGPFPPCWEFSKN